MHKYYGRCLMCTNWDAEKNLATKKLDFLAPCKLSGKKMHWEENCIEYTPFVNLQEKCSPGLMEQSLTLAQICKVINTKKHWNTAQLFDNFAIMIEEKERT